MRGKKKRERANKDEGRDGHSKKERVREKGRRGREKEYEGVAKKSGEKEREIDRGIDRYVYRQMNK